MTGSMTVSMTVSVLTGLLVGGWYFGGLWWTVNRMQRTDRPLQLYVLSLAVRLLVVSVAFYLTIQWFDWVHLLACLAAFLAARFCMILYQVKSETGNLPQRGEESEATPRLMSSDSFSQPIPSDAPDAIRRENV